MKRTSLGDLSPKGSTSAPAPHNYSQGDVRAIRKALSDVRVVQTNAEENKFLNHLFQRHGNVFANPDWQVRMLTSYNNFSALNPGGSGQQRRDAPAGFGQPRTVAQPRDDLGLPHDPPQEPPQQYYDGPDRSAISDILRDRGQAAHVLDSRESFDQFLNYLAQQGFAFDNSGDPVKDVHDHLAAFNALLAASFAPPPSMPAFPVGFGGGQMTVAPPRPSMALCPNDMFSVLQHDPQGFENFLTQNPHALVAVEPPVFHVVAGPHGTVTMTSPSAGHSLITYAVSQDPGAQGGLATLCHLIAQQRAHNPNLPSNILDFWNFHGETPLTTAVAGRSVAAVRALVQAGANVNVTNAEGMPPLTLAMLNEDLPLVQELLSHNALIPIGPTDPLRLMRWAMRNQVNTDTDYCGENLQFTEDSWAILSDLILAAVPDLRATVNDPAASPADIAAKYLERWAQAEFLTSVLEERPQLKPAVDALYNALPGLVPDAVWTLFCSDIALLSQILPICDQAWSFDGGSDPQFGAVYDTACRKWEKNKFTSFDVLNLAFEMNSRQKKYFKGKPATTARFLTFLTANEFSPESLRNPGAEEEKQIQRLFEEFRRIEWETKTLPAEVTRISKAVSDESVAPSEDGADLPDLTKALFEDQPTHVIRGLLDQDCRCLYQNVARPDSKDRLYIAEALSHAFLKNVPLPKSYGEIISKTILPYPRTVVAPAAAIAPLPVTPLGAAPPPGAVLAGNPVVLQQREHPQVGASPLTFAVVNDPEATGQLSAICSWIVDNRSRNPHLQEDTLDFTDFDGNTPLTVAVKEGRIECAELLIESGAGVNAPDARGRTPLMLAAWAGNLTMVNELLAFDANPCAFHNGASAISLALMNTSEDNKEAMNEILDNLLTAAPRYLDRLLARGTASPYEIATVFADELCIWLSLAASPNDGVRDVAMDGLRPLLAKAPAAFGTLFEMDEEFGQELGVKTVTDMLDLMSDISCAAGDDLVQMIEPIYQSIWDEAIRATDLNTLPTLFEEATKRAGSAFDPARYFAAPPTSGAVAPRILARMPQLARERLDSGDNQVVAECLSLQSYMRALGAQGNSPFQDAINQCVSSLGKVIVRHQSYTQMFALLGPKATPYLSFPGWTSSFIAELNRRHINPEDWTFVQSLFEELTRPPLKSAFTLDEMVKYGKDPSPFG